MARYLVIDYDDNPIINYFKNMSEVTKFLKKGYSDFDEDCFNITDKDGYLNYVRVCDVEDSKSYHVKPSYSLSILLKEDPEVIDPQVNNFVVQYPLSGLCFFKTVEELKASLIETEELNLYDSNPEVYLISTGEPLEYKIKKEMKVALEEEPKQC